MKKNNQKDKRKKMNENNVIVIALVLVLIMLLANMFYSAFEYIDYTRRVQSGNDRWLQVEERIVNIEKKVNAIKGGVQ